MKKQLREFRRLQFVCLEQASAASTELEKNAFLEVAGQYELAVNSSMLLRTASRKVQMEGDLQLQSQRPPGECRAGASEVFAYTKSFLWFAFLLLVVIFVAFYVPW
ncbi:hypothetical protein QRQ56_22535 [Bradyrhizobium sp. U531]|uniref:hypothetical protein n=1 Tax=Bradyrhizobium sp. U531 TaxID=3053458 RepID=UPI003F436192